MANARTEQLERQWWRQEKALVARVEARRAARARLARAKAERNHRARRASRTVRRGYA